MWPLTTPNAATGRPAGLWGGGRFSLRPDFCIFVLIVLVVLSIATCSGNCNLAIQDCSSSSANRSFGGAFGGFSTGCEHK